MEKRIFWLVTGLAIAAIMTSPALAQAISAFDRNLKVGTTGADVKQLQILLNTDIDTKVADSGPGSPGKETSLFGPLTKAAVIRFQEKYSKDILAPLGFVSGTGFVGKTTREKLNSIAVKSTGKILTAFVFDRSLKIGTTGADVKQLQILLNTDIDTKVADSGPGSPGKETSLFGPLTKAAVIRFQEKYSKDILAPLGFVSGTGFVGKTTREKLNSILAVRVSTPPAIPAPTPTSAGLSVVLSADTLAASTLLVAGQSLAPLAKFTFTNNDGTEIKITRLMLKRIGDSANSTLSNVYLFEGAKRLGDGTGVLSTGVISFNNPTGIIKIPVGQSKTIIVMSDIASNTNGQTAGISIEAKDDIVSNASSIKGAFPINGNLMKISSVTLADVDFNSTTTPAANSSVIPQNDYTVWQNVISVPTRAINFTRFSLKESGSISRFDLKNFELYVNNVQVGSLVESLDDNGFVTFDLSVSPKRLEAGYSTIKLVADIVSGSSKNFKFSLETAADAAFIDTEYGVNILPTANSSTFTARTSGAQTISTGQVTISQKSGGPVDVVNGISAETLAEFTLKASGEKVKIESLGIEVIWVEKSGSSSVGSLRKGRLFADGEQIAGNENLDVDRTSSDGSGTTFTLSSSLIVEPGKPVTLIVRADIYDNDGTNNLQNEDTLQVNILAGSSNAQGLSSNSTINIPSSSAVTGQVVEIEQGELDLAKYAAFPNKTYVVPIFAAKIAQFTLMSSKEAVDINNIIINLATVTGSVDASDDLSNLYVIYGGNSTTIKSGVVDGDNSWTISEQLEKHTFLDIAVYADVALSAYSSSTTDTIIVRARVEGSGVESGVSAAAPSSSTYTSGQTITFDIAESGDLTGQMAGDSPLDRIVAGNSTVTGAKFKFTAVHDDFLLKTIRLELDEGTNMSGAVLYVILKDGDTIVKDKNNNEAKEKFGAGTGGDLKQVEFTGLEIAIPADTSKTLTFDLALNTPDSDISPATSQANVQLELDKIKYENSLGQEISDSAPGPQNNDPDANNLYVYKSIPLFTHIDLGDNNKIYNGSSTKLYSFKVKADSAEDVSLKQLKFGLNWDNNNSSSLVLDTFKLKRDSEWITTAVDIQDVLGNSLESTTNTVTPSNSAAVFTFDTEETIPAGKEKTYSVYARPSGFQYSSTNGPDTVVINLKGGSDEAAHNGTKRYLVDNATTTLFALNSTYSGDGTGYDVIWSDNSSIYHSYTADNAYPDWANSWLVLDLPLDGEAWQGQ